MIKICLIKVLCPCGSVVVSQLYSHFRLLWQFVSITPLTFLIHDVEDLLQMWALQIVNICEVVRIYNLRPQLRPPMTAKSHKYAACTVFNIERLAAVGASPTNR